MKILVFRDLFYFLSLIPGMLVVFGNLTGGFNTTFGLIFTLVILVASDWLFNSNSKDMPERSSLLPNIVLLSNVICHSLAVITLIWGLYTEIITGVFILTAVLSTGINSGMSGIIIAHELIHKPNKMFRFLGLWNLYIVNYLHWYVEHIRGHHRYVATPLDPATARFSESVYHFILRTIPQQYISALKIEWNQLRKRKKNPILFNFIIWSSMLQIFTWILLAIVNPLILFGFLGQAAVSIFLLEMVNYTEHYGLLRTKRESGSYEPFGYKHAWNTDNRSSRFFLIELTRHSDHHWAAAKPYHTLQSYENCPTLPTGYWGLFPIILIPKLWFRLIHPRLKEFHPDYFYNATSNLIA